ncbi:hypothetical protein D9757_004334 [Collybiopsis confluens]|uniref:AMP-dependent synthetase/ligase domain-containing protein n=1 Tax=Collybiopsis confluens TaxID=2823264 RepID=A0A8H5HUE7_9AGAR|nr:hypothetical protein D9757_004334 [Collybiopsis confluens]
MGFNTSLNTHLSILQASSKRFANSAAFKIPSARSTASAVPTWDTITFKQFHDDVELCAKFWARELYLRSNVQPKSIVGVWIGGFAYSDIVHIYGLSKAGYVPQLFSLRLPNPTVIFELLHKAGAKALICDSGTIGSITPSTTAGNLPILSACPFPDVQALAQTLVTEVPNSYLTTNEEPVDPSEYVFVFHTSGSTSGSPKLVPCTYRWLDAIARKASQLCVPKDLNRQDVSTWIGSMCHIGQTTMLICLMQYGTCVVQPNSFPFSAGELMSMTEHCHVNRIWQFAAFFSAHLRAARQNPKILAMLANLEEVTTCGMALSQEDQDYAYNNGIKLMNIFGSTELGGSTMISVGGSDAATRHHLRPLTGYSYEFRPTHPEEASNDEYQSTNRLLEFVVLSDSGDCPDISLRNSNDNSFHTGDLFIEVAHGRYVFAGRDDDWIKTENSLRCDTKSIEDNARAMCGSLISECIAVGTGRPSPVLFVESNPEVFENKLKKEIWRKIRHFHSRRYIHESITSSNMIIVVPKGSLPRTASKGNIRRKAVEEEYKVQLDKLYDVLK